MTKKRHRNRIDMFSTIFAYVKKYWSLAALVVGTIVGVLLLRREQVGFADNLKKLQDAHDEEIKRIQAAREQEQREHEANLKKLQDALDAVQKHYDDAKKDLDDKKKREITDLVKQYGDDPDALAQKLSEATGFVIILPN